MQNNTPKLFFPTSLCGVLVLLAAIPPASALPSFLPSFPPSSSLPPPLTRSSLPPPLTRSLAHSLTHSRSLTHSLSHSLTHSLTLPGVCRDFVTHSLTHSLIHTTQSITDETAEGPAVSRDCRRASGARGRRWGPGSLRSVQRLQKGLRRAWSPLGARLSPQCPETADVPAARVVAARGPALFRDCRRASGARGRRWGPGSLRSVQRLQKGLRRACSPLGARLSPQCPETAESEVPAARVVAAGGPALFRDCRRASGARGRRWGPGSLRSVQRLQVPAARVVAAGGPALFRDCRRASGTRGRRWGPGSLRSVQRLQKGLRRTWSPLGARLSPQCPAQCFGSLRSVRRSVQRLQKCLRRAWSPLGARLSSETAEGPPARVVAGGPALFRDCRKASGARGRRWGPGSLRSVQRLQKCLRRAWSPLGARLSSETAEGPPARVVAAGGPALSAVFRDCRRASGARGRRWGPGSLRSVQRLQKGAAARVVAAGGPALSAVSGAVFRDCRRGCGARGRRWGPGSRHCDLHGNGCDRLRIALSWLRPGCACTVSVHYCHCDFHSIGSCRFGVAV